MPVIAAAVSKKMELCHKLYTSALMGQPAKKRSPEREHSPINPKKLNVSEAFVQPNPQKN
jgi:hypothetical protein